jgi:hypothetical protein
MKCGREPGGEKSEELGVCRAAVEGSYDGNNFGKNAGRNGVMGDRGVSPK